MKKFIIILIILLICMASTVTYAVDISDVLNQNWDVGSAKNTVENVSGNAIGIMQAIGVSIAIIMLVFVGIKYMTSAPEDKAELKNHLTIYVVGAVLIFAASGLLGIIYEFINEYFNK